MESLPFRSPFHKYRKMFRAVISRLILGGHAVFGAYWIASRLDKFYYILLAATLALFVLETGAIIYFRAGCEWKRFCTPFAVYLMCLVPVLWVLKLHVAEQARAAGNRTDTRSDVRNDTEVDLANIGSIVDKGDSLGQLLADESVPSLLEQSMMIVLILCRWLLPRGRIDRSSLSQLLIMYSAISADVLDFSQIFDTASGESTDMTFQYLVLGVWSWSLVQFTLVVTTSFQFRVRKKESTVKRKPKSANQTVVPDEVGQDKSEALSILMVFFMQDGPFLLARIYAIFVLQLKDFQIMFFSLKNALTLILGLYRLLVLCGCVSREGNDLLRHSEVARSMEALDTVIVDSKSPKVKRAKKGKKQTI